MNLQDTRLQSASVSSESTVRTVLFVDDDPVFLELMERLFRLWSKGRLRLLTTHSVGKAIMLLQDHRVDITVTDIRMPVVDGLQFLKLLHRKHPNMRKVVLTGMIDENYRTACLESGASLFLQKPQDIDEIESVYAAVVDLANSGTEIGFSGLLKQANLGEMVQMLCLGGNSVVLDLQSTAGTGQIFISKGEVLHACTCDAEGYDAFYYLMSLRGGEFTVRPFVEPAMRTILGSWEALLLESARQTDEQAVTKEPALALDSIHSSTRRKFQTVPLPTPKLGRPPRPEIEWDEALACAPDGHVLEAIGLSEPESTADLLSFLGTKAEQIGRLAGLGAVSRVELEGATFNGLAALSAERRALVFSHQHRLSHAELEEKLKQWPLGSKEGGE